MGYAERVLQPGETIAYRGRLHWMLLAPGIFLTAVSALAPIPGSILTTGATRYAILGLCMIIFLVGAWALLTAWLKRVGTEIIVTNRRVILKTGLVSRATIEMNLDKIESVLVNQSLLGRVFDYGTLVIRGVGSGLEPVANVARPLEFHRHVSGVT